MKTQLKKQVKSFKVRVNDELLEHYGDSVNTFIERIAKENGIENYAVRSGKMGYDFYDGEGGLNDLAESKTTFIVTEE